MKKWIVFLFIVLTNTPALFAQHGEKGREMIHAAKMAYITDRIHLTSTQSGNFVPLYNEYEQDARAARQVYKQKYTKAHPDANDIMIMQYVADDLDCQQEILLLKRKYQDRFLKVISEQQLSDLNMAEREFKQILIKKLKDHGGRWDNMK